MSGTLCKALRSLFVDKRCVNALFNLILIYLNYFFGLTTKKIKKPTQSINILKSLTGSITLIIANSNKLQTCWSRSWGHHSILSRHSRQFTVHIYSDNLSQSVSQSVNHQTNTSQPERINLDLDP